MVELTRDRRRRFEAYAAKKELQSNWVGVRLHLGWGIKAEGAAPFM